MSQFTQIQRNGDRISFAARDCNPSDPPLPGVAPLGKLAQSDAEFAAGRKWAEQQAVAAEKAGHPHLAEVWRRVAQWGPGEEVRLCLGAFGMADDVTRKWGQFIGFTPKGPKQFAAMMPPDGKRRNLVIQSAIFDDLYKPRAQALGWISAYDW